MAINLNDNLKINAGKPADSKYLNLSGVPYSSTTQVNNEITISERYVGLTVNINNSEYWYESGVNDIQLIAKSTGSGSGERIEKIVAQTTHGFVLGDIVGYNGNNDLYEKVVSNISEIIEPIGFVNVVDSPDLFTICYAGYVDGLSGMTDANSNPIVSGTTYYLSASVSGKITPNEPLNLNEISKPVLITQSNNDGVVIQYRGALIDEYISGSTGTTVFGINIGTGTGEIFSSTSGVTSYYRTIVGSGGTTVQTIGDDVLIYSETGGTSNASGERIELVVTQANHGFGLGEVVAWSGGTYVSAIATSEFDGEVVGVVIESASSSQFTVIFVGYVSGITLGLSANTTYFLSDSVYGDLTPTKPITAGSVVKPILSTKNSDEFIVYQYVGVVIQTGDTSNIRTVRESSGATYVLDNTADFVAVSSATTTVTLPASPLKGLTITIADVDGTAFSNNITISGNGNNIDDSSTALINSDYGSITLIFTDVIWKIIAFT